MVVGEAANFAAYAFAPAILVTPLGALSIIVSALLADAFLGERLNAFGWVGCALCINGSVTIVLHAPPERALASVQQVWDLAMAPAFLTYALCATAVLVYLIRVAAPKHGTSNIFIYLGICSTAGSLSVVCCKALGVAVKLTFRGSNQLTDPHTLVFVAVRCITVCGLLDCPFFLAALPRDDDEQQLVRLGALRHPHTDPHTFHLPPPLAPYTATMHHAPCVRRSSPRA